MAYRQKEICTLVLMCGYPANMRLSHSLFWNERRGEYGKSADVFSAAVLVNWTLTGKFNIPANLPEEKVRAARVQLSFLCVRLLDSTYSMLACRAANNTNTVQPLSTRASVPLHAYIYICACTVLCFCLAD